MSAMRWRCRTLVTMGAVVTVLWLAGGAAAQAPRDEGRDYLDQARRLTEIAAQKVEAEVRDAGRDADRLSATDPGAAARRLQTALKLVEADTALAPARRDNLARALRLRIRLLQTSAAREADKTPARQALSPGRRAGDEDALGQALDRIHALRKEGRLDEARRLADELGQRYPDNPVVQAMIRNTGTAFHAAGARSQRTESDQRLLGVSQGVQRSSTPPAGTIEFPADWTERTKNRTGLVRLTDKEKAILQGLNSTVAVQFKGERFEDVIKFLSDRIKQPILLDKVALNENLVNYDTQVNLDTNGQKLSVRTILRKILSDNSLTYVIRDQAIEVTSTLNAQKMMVVRTYPIGDILSGGFGGLFGYSWQGPPGVAQAQLQQQVQQIIDMIQSSVDPQSWGNNGGGTITFHAPTMSLVIRQSAEVHGMLAGSMAR